MFNYFLNESSFKLKMLFKKNMMKKFLYKILNKIKNAHLVERSNNFDSNNPLGGGGERVDLFYSDDINVNKLDIYQISHLRRYQFANETVPAGILCGDLACGTGYGSVLLSKKDRKVIGIDINVQVIEEIKIRYKNYDVEFLCKNLLDLDYEEKFDFIFSFETVEHFEENNIIHLFTLFNRALKKNGSILFSVPYMQADCENAKKLGFHLTFFINESKIETWAFKSGLRVEKFWYQNYETHFIQSSLDKPDFIICKLVK